MKKIKPNYIVKVVLMAFLAVTSITSNAQIVQDATSSLAGTFTTSSTVAHTTGSGSNRLMIVGVSRRGTNTLPSGVTYNGISLTQLGGIANGNAALAGIWYLVNPPTGTFDVVTTIPDIDVEHAIGVVTYEGVDQANPFGTLFTNTGSGSGVHTLTVSSATDELVIDVFSASNLIAIPDPGQTQLWGLVNGSGSTKSGATSVDMSWSTTFTIWAHAAVSIKADLTGITSQSLNPTIDIHLSSQASSTATLGTCSPTKVFNDGSGDANILYKFDLSSIPANATITGATFSAYKSAGTTNETIGLFRTIQDWTYTSGCNIIGFPTYTQSASGTNWTTPGGDYDPAAISSTSVSASNQYYAFDATSLVQDWIDGTHPNYGFILDHESGPGTQTEFFTLENGNATTFPKLKIYYATVSLTTTVTNESCTGASNGAVDLSVTGNSGMTTYSWTGPNGFTATTEDISGLVAGTYNVTVTDDSGDNITSAIIATSSSSLTFNQDVTYLTSTGSSDGAIDLTVTEGSGNYTYTWNKDSSPFATTEDISGLSAGLYEVTITDVTCSTQEIASVLMFFNENPTNVQKYLYLTDPSQGLDRIDPVASADATTASTAILNAFETSNVSDNFDVDASYSGSNSTGSLDWSSDWIETDGAGGGATSGGVQVSGNALKIYDSTSGSAAYREVDLSSVSSAILSFDFVNAMNHNNDEMTIDLSLDGGSTFPHILGVFDRNTTSGTKVFQELVNAIGPLTANTVIRIWTSSNGGAGNNYSSFDNISIAYELLSTATETFIQGTPMCTDFTISGGQSISASIYATVTSGTMPANPDISASLEFGSGPSLIIKLLNPTWDGTKLTWTGTVGNEVTIPAGESASLVVTTNEPSAAFTIDYDSQTAPSKIQIPTSTYISIEAMDVYDAAYSGGSIITENIVGQTAYLRTTVSDPFGTYDITALDYKITDPNAGVTTVTATEVATSGCTKTYEYAWTIPEIGGEYSIQAIAHEGTEGVTYKFTKTFTGIISVSITKSLSSPATGPYTINDNLTYTLTIENGGPQPLTTLPLQDNFDASCLEFVSTTEANAIVGPGTISWLDLGPLAGNSTKSFDVVFKVIGNCDPARNTAKIEGAIDNSSNLLPSVLDTVDIIIDEAPIAMDDQFFISSMTNLSVLLNDFDADNDMTTLFITNAPSVGSATVNGLTIDFDPATMTDNASTTFTYSICDNASPTPYCDVATVTVVLSDFNDPPVLVNDNEVTTIDLPITVDVLQNDSDVDGNLDISSMTITSNPNFGAAIINADGTINYSPNPGFIGADQITYQICDDGFPLPVECQTATLDLTVIFAYYACQTSTSTLSVLNVSGADGYTWALPPGAVIVNGAGTNNVEVDFSAVAAGTYNVCVNPTNDCGPGTEQCVDIVVNEVIVTPVVTDVLCNGELTGAIDITASGGVPAYSYSWSNGASVEDLSGLTAGTYDVTTTDRAGCIGTASATITEPATSVDITNAVITNEDPYGTSNGAIDITVAGGTPGYAYEWTDINSNLISTSQDPSGLSGGTYTVIVTDLNGCSTTETYTANTIGGPLQVSLLIATDVLCFGESTGTVDLEVIGGTGSYTYSWSNSATTQDLTNIPTGTYDVTISDGVNPDIMTSATVNGPASALSLSIFGTNLMCNGDQMGSIDLTSGGGTAPYTYEWSNGEAIEDIDNLGAGTYTVTVTDSNGCTNTISETITEPSLLEVSGNITHDDCDSGGDGTIDITASGGSAPYTYNWSNGETTQDITGLEAGYYSVTVEDAALCTQISTFDIQSACLAVAKSIVGTPINNGDGSYQLTYEIKIENSGDFDLTNIQVEENLQNTFATANGYTLENVTITSQPTNTWSANISYDGNLDDNLLMPSGQLNVGEIAVFHIEVTVIPGMTLTYNNTVNANAETPEGKSISDISQSGEDPDPDTNGNPGDNNDPTPVTFSESPQIALAKDLGSIMNNNGDGTYTISYLLRVENTGDIILNNIQVTDTLSNAFPGLNLSNVSVNVIQNPASSTFASNANYSGLATGDVNVLSGVNTLSVGEYALLEIVLTIELDGSLGMFNNTASAIGVSPANTIVSDVSHYGNDPDPEEDGPIDNIDPTPVAFLENPLLEVIKIVEGEPTINPDGTFDITYTIQVSNRGDVPIYNLQVTDDLSAAFPGLTISNVTTSIISLPSTLSLNGTYDGIAESNLLTGFNQLAVGELEVIQVMLTVLPIDNLGPYTNLVSADGEGPGGTPTSDDGSIPVTFTENPSIGIAKNVDVPVNNEDGSYTFNYTINIENTGDVTLNEVQVADNLSNTFAGAAFTLNSINSSEFSVNVGYDGTSNFDLLDGTDQLIVNGTGTIVINLTVVPGTNLGPYNNTANASANGIGGNPVTDDSYYGSSVDPDNDGDPTNNSSPTPVTFEENPIIGIAKTVVSPITIHGDGSYTLTYEMKVQNIGDVPLYNVQVIEDLKTTFELANSFSTGAYSITQQPVSTVLNINGTYNGDTDNQVLDGLGTLLVSEFAVMQVEVTVIPGNYGGPYNNTAITLGSSPGGRTILDASEDGTNVDPDMNDDPTDNNAPTPVEFNTTMAEDDINQTLVNIPVSGDVSTNDFDREIDNQTITSALADTDGDGLVDDIITIGSPVSIYGKDENGVIAVAGTITLNSDGTYYYLPSTGFIGTVEVNYTVTDDNVNPAMADAILLIDVNGENTNNLYPPIALNDNAITDPDINVDLNILNNDSDLDGTLALATIDLDPTTPGIQTSFTVAGEGVYTVDPTTGIVTFDPDPSLLGTTTPIEYQVCDDDGLCDIAAITVTIGDPNVNKMSAEDDANSGFSGDALTGNIMHNDIDPDGSNAVPSVATVLADTDGDGVLDNMLTIGIPTAIYGEDPDNPGNYIEAGTLTVSTDGTYSYESHPDFTGTVYVPYTACDNDVINACDEATLYLTTAPLCVVIDVKVILEGPYQQTSSVMTSFLNNYHLLPGQDPTQSSNVGAQLYGTAAPQGQPYNVAPWNYAGTEGDNYGDAGGKISYPSTVTDWILVSIRDTFDSLTPIWQCAALLHIDGSVTFPEECPCMEAVNTEDYYIIIEHRNHLSVMSQAVVPVNGILSFDFTTTDSWKQNIGSPQEVTQKNIDGTLVMYAGNSEQINGRTDMNSFDNSNWILDNGNIFKYLKGDHLMDGDVNSFDRAIWIINNGQFQLIPY